jgi:hypothetical protein
MAIHTAYDTGTFALASTIKKGEYVKRNSDAKKVYRMAGYCRFNKAYQLDDETDISRAIYVKGTVALFVGFTY